METITKFKRPKPTLFVGFDEIETNRLKVHRYILGERADRLKGLTTDFFDMIQFMGNSQNAINELEFIHAIGWSKKTNRYIPLILKLCNTTKSKS